MKSALFALALVGVTTALVGCQTMPYQPYAREVKKKPNQGGLIALKTEHRDEDRQKATMLMASNCGNGAVKVVEEGEVVTGVTTTANTNTRDVHGTQDKQVGTLFGMPLVQSGQQSGQDHSTTSTTSQNKEWQISYECEKAVAADTSASPITPVKAKKKTSKQ